MIPKPKTKKKLPSNREELGSDFWYDEEDEWTSGTKVQLFKDGCFSDVPAGTYEMQDEPSVMIDESSCIV